MENRVPFLAFLESRSYRQLQQLAKSLSLPSNYKKIYLIDLIKAKKFRSEQDVIAIIQKVKQERKLKSKEKKQSSSKKKLKCESRKSMSYSPPITITPKRFSETNINSSPLNEVNPKRSLLQNINENNMIPSDRVLRSYNVKTTKPNYAVMNNNIQDLKSECFSNTMERAVKLITNRNNFQQFNGIIKIKRKRTNITSTSRSVLKQPVELNEAADILHNPDAAKRQRTISGIYPLLPHEITPRSIFTSTNLCLRNVDGSYTEIPALVRKCNRNVEMAPKNNCYQNKDINLQDIINNSIDATIPINVTNAIGNSDYLKIQYPNVSSIESLLNNATNILTDNYKENELSDIRSIFHKKKMRAEKICQRLRDKQQSERLPTFNDAFTRFHNLYRRDPVQPLYVPVTREPDTSQYYPTYINNNCSNGNILTLENIYTIKPSTVSPQSSVADTKCVYSTGTMMTATLSPSTVVPSNDALNVNYLNRTSSPETSETCPDMDTSSIPEMFEDALEVISQDGDYMDQTSMGTRVQCVFCSWAGPKIVLEGHVRKEHPDEIHIGAKSEWNITYTLESLVQCKMWLNKVLEHNTMLYMLSAKYEDPGCLMATLSVLSSEPVPTEKVATITIYNKITGEPFSWSGQIPDLPPNLPYDNDASCLRVDLSKLDLLPNSANLKLVNRELVTESPNKVFVGQPALNDIHIILFIQIMNEHCFSIDC